MKRTLLYLFGVCLMAVFMALSNKQKPVIYMIGDSTMANKSLAGGNPERGWGHVLPGFFSPEIKIDNHAVNGRSSLSFMSRWNAVYDQLKKGDYVLFNSGTTTRKRNPTVTPTPTRPIKTTFASTSTRPAKREPYPYSSPPLSDVNLAKTANSSTPTGATSRPAKRWPPK